MESLVEQACEDAAQMIREQAPLGEILTRLATLVERIAPEGSAGSILVLDESGLLRNGASPRLPADYLHAIDRLKPDAELGTCAAAAATGQFVVTRSFHDDSKWAELRHLPLALGYAGACSMPIKSRTGQVLGTVGTYYREAREPSPAERAAVERIAATAAAALEASRSA